METVWNAILRTPMNIPDQIPPQPDEAALGVTQAHRNYVGTALDKFVMNCIIPLIDERKFNRPPPHLNEVVNFHRIASAIQPDTVSGLYRGRSEHARKLMISKRLLEAAQL